MLSLTTGDLPAAPDTHRPEGLPLAVGPLAGLTARQREVLGWVAAGKTNRDIAAILGARPRTIEKHLERIYEKLGVENRTAAVMRCLAYA